jgi:hypothetical protein
MYYVASNECRLKKKKEKIHVTYINTILSGIWLCNISSQKASYMLSIKKALYFLEFRYNIRGVKNLSISHAFHSHLSLNELGNFDPILNRKESLRACGIAGRPNRNTER